MKEVHAEDLCIFLSTMWKEGCAMFMREGDRFQSFLLSPTPVGAIRTIWIRDILRLYP